MIRLCMAFSVLMAVVFASTSAVAEMISINSRGETFRLLIDLSNDAPAKAVVLLLGGGHGKVRIKNDGSIGWGRNNFAIRSRTHLNAFSLATAVMSGPSDKMKEKKGLKGWRTSDEHLADLKAAIDHLRGKFGLPVWVHGTSRGAISAAHAAIGLDGTESAPAGTILSAGVNAPNSGGDHIRDMNLGKITGPVLVQYHAKDECRVTSPKHVPEIMEMLKNARVKKALMYDGGGPPEGKVCHAKHWHGFKNIEREVSKDQADFIVSMR